MMQITALEAEVSKMQKNLDTARASYQSLQKQYQEQCGKAIFPYMNTMSRSNLCMINIQRNRRDIVTLYVSVTKSSSTTKTKASPMPST